MDHKKQTEHVGIYEGKLTPVSYFKYNLRLSMGRFALNGLYDGHPLSMDHKKQTEHVYMREN